MYVKKHFISSLVHFHAKRKSPRDSAPLSKAAFVVPVADVTQSTSNATLSKTRKVFNQRNEIRHFWICGTFILDLPKYR